MTGLSIDIGKSATRYRAAPVEGVLHGLPPESASGPEGVPLLSSRVLACLRAAPGVETVVVGTTFLPGPGACAEAARVVLAEHPGVGIALADDGVVTHAGLLGGPGVVAAIGTGVIVTAVRDGAIFRVDGWGPDLGDRGSAADIGRAGLAAACADLDGAGPRTVLRAAAERFLGGPLGHELAARLLAHPDRVARMAGFAVEVVAGAEAGDGVSLGIVEGAASAIAASCLAAGGPGDVLVTGRLAGMESFRALLALALGRLGLVLRETDRSALDASWATMTREPYASACAVLLEPTHD